MNRQSVRAGILGAILSVCLAALPAWGEDLLSSWQVEPARIGLSGRYQLGTWTPVAVPVTLNGPATRQVHLTVLAPDADGQLVATSGLEQTAKPGSPLLLRSRFIAGRPNGDIIIRVESRQSGFRHDQIIRPSDTKSSNAMPALHQDVPLWALCGLSETVFATAFNDSDSIAPASNRNVSEKSDARPEFIPTMPADLSEESVDYSSLDVIVLAATSEIAGTGKTYLSQLTSAQQRAVADWVQNRGGHLVLSVGSHLDEFKSSELANWLKLPLLEEISVRELDALLSYSPHPSGLSVEATAQALRLGPTGGNVLARSLDGPLLVQLPMGFGRVSFLAVDLDRPPLKTWEGLGHLLRKVTSIERDQIRGTRIKATQLAKSAINDLSSQLYAAQDEFPAVTRPSLWVVMGLLGIYLLIIGPLDFWLVHRWLKRPHWTWVTLALWIGVGSAVIVGISNWINGRELRVKQLDVVDLDQTSNVMRGRSWVTLYSPRTARSRIELTGTLTDWGQGEDRPRGQSNTKAASGKPAANKWGGTPLVAWSAPAENSVGGLYREGGVQLSQREYHTVADSDGFADYPLQVWSTCRIAAEWSGKVPQWVESKLVSSELGRLTGSVTHHLPGTLSDCLLAYANRVYVPVTRRQGAGRSDLNSHFTWEIGGGQPVEQRDLRSFLTQVYTKEIRTGSSKISSELLDLQTPYDASSRDLNYIMRMLTFHQAAGGSDYTGLRHDVLGNFDLSTHLRLGRAVLLGRLKKSSAEWTVDGKILTAPESNTYVRIVLPVDRAGESSTKALLRPDE